MVQAESTIRDYSTRAESTGTFGRVLCSARDQHLVVDGPAQNGCPGEAITPAELFLSGVAACGVELIQVLARDADLPLQSVAATVDGRMDRAAPVRPDVTLFNQVRIQFQLTGVSEAQARDLVDRFTKR